MQALLGRLREFSFSSALLRLLLAMLSGGVVGFGRSQKARAAGFRTQHAGLPGGSAGGADQPVYLS